MAMNDGAMVEAHLYRGDILYRVEFIPKGVPELRIRHSRRWAYSEGAPDPAALMCECAERFVLLRNGDYVSTDYGTLPLWVKQQELEDAEKSDRQARFDRMMQMMMEHHEPPR